MASDVVKRVVLTQATTVLDWKARGPHVFGAQEWLSICMMSNWKPYARKERIVHDLVSAL